MCIYDIQIGSDPLRSLSHPNTMPINNATDFIVKDSHLVDIQTPVVNVQTPNVTVQTPDTSKGVGGCSNSNKLSLSSDVGC